MRALLACLAFASAALAQREGWRIPAGAQDLIVSGGWSCLSGLDPLPEGVRLRTGNGFSTPINQRFRLEPQGDFSVRGRLRVRSGSGAIALVGQVGEGEWWRGLKRLDLTLSPTYVAASWYTGASTSNTELRLTDSPGESLDFEIARIGPELVFFVDGTEQGRVNDPGLFVSGRVFLGLNGYPNSELILETLSASVPDGTELALGGNRPHVAVPSDSSLRALAGSKDLLIGGAIATSPLTRAIYAETAGREFNVLVAENDMKFGPIHPARDRYSFCAADDIVAFAEANGMKVRGHALVWHQQNPRWLDEGTFSKEELLDVLREHTRSVMGRYKGRIFAWDVVNESFQYGPPYGWMPSIWQRVLGAPDYIEAAFRIAREVDPDAKLFYNEIGGEGLGAKSDRVYELMKELKGKGVPVDGVGLQMHVQTTPPPRPEDIAKNISRLGELGLEVHITEMDVRSPLPLTPDKLEAEAKVYRDILTVCRAAPNCKAIVTWGVTDAISWIPGQFPGNSPGLLFDANYQPKPAYQAVTEVLQRP